MTLIISVRTPDGIVMAADSLGTVNGIAASPDGIMFPYPLPSQFRAAKIMPFSCRFAIGVHGPSIPNLAGGFQALFADMESTLQKQHEKILWIDDAVSRIQEFIAESIPVQKRPNICDGPGATGLLISGYGSDGVPATARIPVCKPMPDATLERGHQYAIAGSLETIDVLKGLWSTELFTEPNPNTFSLQDAIDFAEFLIKTTAGVHLFGAVAPSVNSVIDVLVIERLGKVRWVQKRRLSHG